MESTLYKIFRYISNLRERIENTNYKEYRIQDTKSTEYKLQIVQNTNYKEYRMR